MMDLDRKLAEINRKTSKTIFENKTPQTDENENIREIFREELRNMLPMILEEFYRDKLVLEKTGENDEMLLKVGGSVFKGRMELVR
jgi:hypothetical protein